MYNLEGHINGSTVTAEIPLTCLDLSQKQVDFHSPYQRSPYATTFLDTYGGLQSAECDISAIQIDFNGRPNRRVERDQTRCMSLTGSAYGL